VQQSQWVAGMPRINAGYHCRHHRCEGLPRGREDIAAFAFEKRMQRAFDSALAESAEPLVCWHARPASYVASKLLLCQIMVRQ
jgi:hypothetical protein